MILKPLTAAILVMLLIIAFIPQTMSDSINSPEEYFDIKIPVNARYLGGNIIEIEIRFDFVNKLNEPVHIRILDSPRISLIYSNTTDDLRIPCKSKLMIASADSTTTYATAKLYVLINNVPGKLIIYAGLVEVLLGDKSLANLTKTISYNTSTASSRMIFNSTASKDNRVAQPIMDYRKILYRVRSPSSSLLQTITTSPPPQINLYEVVRLRTQDNGEYNIYSGHRYVSVSTYIVEITGLILLVLTILMVYLLKNKFT
ncbi:MAG: hypothetical protein GXO43_09010 [Crenarchaeota archaeon]|nr:hypothetical protein [Thermoproteota archaeon]